MRPPLELLDEAEQLVALRDDHVLRSALALLDVDLAANYHAEVRAASTAAQLHQPPVPTFRRQMNDLRRDAVIAELLAAEAAERRRTRTGTSKAKKIAANIAAGRCARCGGELGRGKRFCDGCLEDNRLAGIRYRAKQAAAGRCTLCGDPAKPGGRQCQRCADRNAVHARRTTEKRRRKRLLTRLVRALLR